MQGTTGKMLIAALALGIAGCVSSDHSITYEAGEIKIMRVKGMARCSLDHKTWMEVKKDMTFKPGVVVQTGPKSVVDVCMPRSPLDNSEDASDREIRIFENSALKFSKVTRVESRGHVSEEFKIDLLLGQMLGGVGLLSQDCKYEVKLVEQKLVVYGGTFMASSSGVVNVLKGSVVSIKTNHDGSETSTKIGSGESYDPSTGTVTRITTDQVTRIFGSPGPPDKYVCGALPQIPTADSVSTSGAPHGSGLGRSLEKFP